MLNSNPAQRPGLSIRSSALASVSHAPSKEATAGGRHDYQASIVQATMRATTGAHPALKSFKASADS